MNFNTPHATEEIVISTLASSSQNGETLLATIRTIRPHFTKQALYVVLRKLLQQEVIVKHGKQFSLGRPWLSRMTQFFSLAQERYGVHQEGVDFLNLQDGDKISYSFKSPEETDRFWGHVFDVLAEVMPHDEPIYIYNPHEWFVLARQESELHLLHSLRDAKRLVWITVGHRDALDVYVKRYFDGTYLQYHMHDVLLFENESYYLNVFGSYIVEAHLDIITARKVDELYKTTEVWNESVERALKALIGSGKTKLTISRNERKAKKLKKLLGQYFFVVQK